MKLIYLRKSKDEYIFREANTLEIFANHKFSKLLGKLFRLNTPNNIIIEVDFNVYNENKSKTNRNE